MKWEMRKPVVDSVVDADPDPDFIWYGSGSWFLFDADPNTYPYCVHCTVPILPVQWIRDILVRIRTRWSVPLTSVSVSCFFLQSFFSLLLFEVIFTSVFKDKKSKRSHKIVETKFFLLVLFVDGRIRISRSWSGSVQILTDPDPESPKSYGSHGSDPNPLYSVGSSTGTVP